MQCAHQGWQDPPLLERRGELPNHIRQDRAAPRPVRYLGEINDARRAARCKIIEVVYAGADPAKVHEVLPGG